MRDIVVGSYQYIKGMSISDIGGTNTWDHKIKCAGLQGVKFAVVLVPIKEKEVDDVELW